MKFQLFPILVWMSAGCLSAGEEPERGERDPGSGFVKDFLKMADADRDGAVSVDEFLELERLSRLPEEKRRWIFARLDKDDDGFLKEKELERMRPERGRRPMPRLKELDVDGDGGIDFEEFSASKMIKRWPEERRKAFFDRLDRDSDGKLTPRDHPEHGGPANHRRHGPPPPRDHDGDGIVSFDEFQTAPHFRGLSEDEQKDRFEALDRNGDGELDASEIPGAPAGHPSGKGPRDENR